MKCCSSERYKSQETFVFTPGHSRTIFAIAEKVRKMNEAAVQPIAVVADVNSGSNELPPSPSATEDSEPPLLQLDVNEERRKRLEAELKSSLVLKVNAKIVPKSKDYGKIFTM